MSLKIYYAIAVPITYLFIYGLVRANISVVVASGIAGLVLSQWYEHLPAPKPPETKE